MAGPRLIVLGCLFVISASLLIGCRGRTDGAAPDPNLKIVLSEADFSRHVLESELPVLVDFWATWCPPCRAMEPVIKEAAVRYKGDVDVAKVDVDQNRALAEKYKIRAIPTFILFHKGKIIGMYEGAIRPKELDLWVQEQLKQAGV